MANQEKRKARPNDSQPCVVYVDSDSVCDVGARPKPEIMEEEMTESPVFGNGAKTEEDVLRKIPLARSDLTLGGVQCRQEIRKPVIPRSTTAMLTSRSQ